MSHQLQTLSALLIVAAAAVWLVLRAVARRSKPGCGGDCGCSSGDLRAKAVRRDKAG
ncbi:MAG TPA: FeoB-associated Cys-rich membrane protein [Opitutaceae bacterium]|nr:FeoB-associated Cys-rich membrane protein [Opitutaceae bacterium]